jgi:hypothetical protein
VIFLIFFVFVVLPHSELEFLVILCTCILPEVLSPEADLRPRPSMHTHTAVIGTERRVQVIGQPVQYLKNMNTGQNLR